jgi:hypothetical protein
VPCDQVRRITLNIQAMDRTLLLAALAALGLRVREASSRGVRFVTPQGQAAAIRDGEMVIPAQELALVNRIKQQYAKETLKAVAKKFGWRLQGTGTQFTLQKRGL